MSLASFPPTYIVTARTDGSGIRLYRKPADWEGQDQRDTGIEFIDRNHRYLIAPGSWHHIGQLYRLRTTCRCPNGWGMQRSP
ncbi:bifunctional DNA primase/polymerase [Mycolicibacterium mengxianglii]|uniref:bifunctional DNA primase/polymerase n=1 Tax=Mycolicibacterium mengxianglii TaxID=2736649 RepID=UPI0018EEE3CA